MRGPVLGGVQYRTWGAAADAFREVLKLPTGTVLYPGSKQFDLLLDTLKLHPDAAGKMSGGVTYFKIIRNHVGTGHGLVVGRADGTMDGFSYKKCLRASPYPAINDFKRTCREEVHQQIDAARYKAFASGRSIQCPVIGEIITAMTCHIDHVPPNTFAKLVDDFMAANSIRPELVEYAPQTSPTVPAKFADRALAAAWQNYHAEHAVLRAVSVKANLIDIPRAAKTGKDKR